MSDAPGPDQPRREEDERPNFHGHEPRRCGEHRTMGWYRAWCYDCSEWCHPEDGCAGCKPHVDDVLEENARYSAALRAMARRCGKMRQGLLAFQGRAKEYRAEATRLRADLTAARTAQDSALDAAEKAVEALEAQGAVVEALNRENARLCADLLAVEGQGMEAEVRVEFGYQAPEQARPTPQSSQRWAQLSARNEGGTVYRRTVTTSPWVEVPAEDEGGRPCPLS